MEEKNIIENDIKDSILADSPAVLLNLDPIENKNLKIIQVQILFLSFGEVDTMNEKFQAQVKITANWLENEIIDKYNPDVHWNPKLFIENAFPDLKEEVTHKTKFIDEKTTQIIQTRMAKGLINLR